MYNKKEKLQINYKTWDNLKFALLLHILYKLLSLGVQHIVTRATLTDYTIDRSTFFVISLIRSNKSSSLFSRPKKRVVYRENVYNISFVPLVFAASTNAQLQASTPALALHSPRISAVPNSCRCTKSLCYDVSGNRLTIVSKIKVGCTIKIILLTAMIPVIQSVAKV